MDLFNIFTLLGGLAFFLYGMQILSSGLEKIAGVRLKKLLKEMTSNPLKGLALGTTITIAIQSSSALTVILVGLVNSGIMTLKQSIGVIMGSNIGTTITAWILSLTGIESSNFFIRMLKPDSFSPVLAFIGICMVMMAKTDKKKNIGSFFIGFAILMFGMQIMSNSMSPLADMPEFSNIMTAFTNPILGVIVGALLTGIIQSSAASVGILQALSLTGGISYGMAIPIIMGQNIGTCVTSLLSSFGVSVNAKRVAAVHITFNILGVLICLPAFYIVHYLLNLNLISKAINPFGIAICHSIFNVLTTIVLLPFIGQLEKIAITVVKDNENNNQDKKQEEFVILDERLLLSPSFAITECSHHTFAMADLSEEILFESTNMLEKYSASKASDILASEGKLDVYEDKLNTFLVKIAGKDLSDSDSNEVSKLLHIINDLERIGDYAVSITYAAKEMHEKNIQFSNEAQDELKVLTNAIHEILELTVESFETNDNILATKIEPLEQVIDALVLEIKNRHIKRLKEGACTIELGFLLSDLLIFYQRVSDHCSNIAACIIQMKLSQLEMHNYLNSVKNVGNEDFTNKFKQYQEKYFLSENLK